MPAGRMIAIATLGFVLTGMSGCTASPERQHTANASRHEPIVFYGVIDEAPGIYQTTTESKPILITARANWPEPSPDGRHLLFQRRSDAGDLDLWRCAIDGSNPRRLTSHPAHEYLPSWSPDGRWIVFTTWRLEEGDLEPAPHLYLVASEGGTARRLMAELLGTSAGATWTPDGRSIVFGMKHANGDSSISIASIDTAAASISDRRELVRDARSNGTPVVSPDGRYIAYYSSDDAASWLMIVGIDGGPPRPVLTEGFNWYPRWSPDGRRLIFTRAVSEDQEDLDIYEIDLAGGPPRPVIEFPGRQAEARYLNSSSR